MPHSAEAILYHSSVRLRVSFDTSAALKATGVAHVTLPHWMVSLVGFGSWSVTRRAARDGRNPQTGATIKIAAKNVVKFKAGAELSGSVN